ncbi:hypothetical protein LTS18_006561 [Coniosporium uncinatum]|uniref:Uncharacterized protein n=1 Tax=Coniosporium uncinatum TaxID=93489 RepID=A0ACC3D436_9PEZI|nr:hypothetical protein LTS18_006561 [Coniosporium uncinatum]
MSSDDQYEQQNDAMAGTNDVPAGNSKDNDYASRTGQSHIPVQTDDAPVEESPYKAETADSDAQLVQDEQDALKEGETVSSRTRGATKASGTYTEPGDEEVSEEPVL